MSRLAPPGAGGSAASAVEAGLLRPCAHVIACLPLSADFALELHVVECADGSFAWWATSLGEWLGVADVGLA